MHEIIIGRNPEDLETFGHKGTGVIGKHLVGTKKEAHLTNNVRIDLARPHIIGLFGKRGTGKSYTMGTIAEELLSLPDDIRKNIGAVIIDTMGIYWSMNTANEKDSGLLGDWGIKPEAFKPNILIPQGITKHYQDNEIPFDGTFSFKPSTLDIGAWALAFNLDLDTELGVLLAQVVDEANDLGESFTIKDMINLTYRQDSSKTAKTALANRLMLADKWGIFDENASSIYNIVIPGRLSIIDVSQLGLESGGWSVRSLVVGLLARKILEERIKARRAEELEVMDGGTSESPMPITWMLIDEAHQFLPAIGETAASKPLLQWVKIGREPGVSLVLATQMPNKLHQEAISQCDLVIAHRLTSRKDMQSLSEIMQSYLKYDIPEYFDALPRVKGAALILDDNCERIFEIRTRPRKSWHAGGSPSAIKTEH
ncbi:MAG: ATP-binding protein [Candidatus Aenigmarchaeota archaeon]|nr:ATP-binding protein [Candidatus Aenigmarchaeota archaeon]